MGLINILIIGLRNIVNKIIRWVPLAYSVARWLCEWETSTLEKINTK